MDVLVLTAADPSLYSDAVSWAGQRWASAEAMQADRETEGELEVRHRSMLPPLRPGSLRRGAASQRRCRGSWKGYPEEAVLQQA